VKSGEFVENTDLPYREPIKENSRSEHGDAMLGRRDEGLVGSVKKVGGQGIGPI